MKAKEKDIVKIGKKCFRVDKVIFENGKPKYIIDGLGKFNEKEIRNASEVDKFLFLLFGSKEIDRQKYK